jgi:ubiquinone/menaquinone biosynthesis C-methylase UbiE
MGGPARWIAHRVGCHVTGLDFTLSRVESARRLTLRVGLDRLVDFVHGDATSMPFPNAVFDVAISQEAWLHIPDKSAVIGQCVRVLKADGVLAFTDVMRRGSLTMAEESRLTTEMQAPQVASTERYLELLRSRGCTVSGFDDLSAEWTRILADRLEMYRALRDTTVAKFGEAHFAAWDRAYSFFVGLFAEGKLGGTRIVARTPAR